MKESLVETKTEQASASKIEIKTIHTVDSKKKCNRCEVCKIKTQLNFFDCKCSAIKIFCATHRFPHQHSCTFDWKSETKRRLSVSNPVVVCDKFTKI